MTAKLGDFGFARPLPKIPEGQSFIRTAETCGTTGYIAPEFQRGELGEKVDVFGFGVVSMVWYAYCHVFLTMVMLQVALELYSELCAYDKQRKIPCLVSIASIVCQMLTQCISVKSVHSKIVLKIMLTTFVNVTLFLV